MRGGVDIKGYGLRRHAFKSSRKKNVINPLSPNGTTILPDHLRRSSPFFVLPSAVYLPC